MTDDDNELQLKVWSATDVGRVRKQNEDFCLVDNDLKLYIVCDGMGGHAAGEVASQTTAEVVAREVRAKKSMIQSFASGDSFITRKDVVNLLEEAVQKACSEVYHIGMKDESKRGMGTTIDALLLVGHRGFIAHVGDSRVYMYRQGSVHQLTEDHSLINELLKRGRLTRDQVERVQYKNAVTRAVGVYENVEVDVLDFDILAGDRFVLCSDGLHGYLEDGELAHIIEEENEENFTSYLIALANKRGGNDNITSIFVRIADQAAGLDERTQDIFLKLELLHKMPLFRYATFKELVRIMNITNIREYDVAENVVVEGDHGDELFIVYSGEVQVYANDQIIANLSVGQHFGEMALIDKSPRNTTVTTLKKTKLLVIRRHDFFDLVRKNHDLAVKLLWSFLGTMAQRTRIMSQELGEIREQIEDQSIIKELLDNVNTETSTQMRTRRDTLRNS